MADDYTKHLQEMGLDIKPQVAEAINIITKIPEVESAVSNMESMTADQLEGLILSLGQEHHEAAAMKRKGYSYKEIADSLGLKSAAHAQRMVAKVLHVGYHLSIQDKEILRSQCLDELDDMTRSLWRAAEDEGRDYLNVREVKANISVIGKKIEILGVSAPVEVSVDVSTRVKEATDKLQTVLNNVHTAKNLHNQLREEGLIIDVEVSKDSPTLSSAKLSLEDEEY